MALQWVLEQASPAIARTLAAIPDASAAAVAIPDADGIPPDKMIRLFSYAVEFANTGNLPMEDSDALNLWTLAAMLQVRTYPKNPLFNPLGLHNKDLKRLHLVL